MANLTIRDLDDAVKQALRELAAQSGRSMEAEARIALQRHVRAARPRQSLGALYAELFPEGLRADLEVGDRRDDREAPQF